MKKLMLVASLFLLVFSSCKKKDAASLVGKWTVEKVITKYYTNNQLVDTEEEPGMGATIDFKTNGKATVNFPGAPAQEVEYSVSGSKLTMFGQQNELQNQTSTSVTIYSVDVSGSDKEETFTYLKK